MRFEFGQFEVLAPVWSAPMDDSNSAQMRSFVLDTLLTEFRDSNFSIFITPQSLMMATFFTNGPEAECAASAASSHRHCHGFVVRTENENPLRNILIRGLSF
jgi:hypothetical protein